MTRTLDKGLILAIFFLLGLGLVQVYSSSYLYAIETYGDGLFFFRKQLLFSLVTLLMMVGIALTPWRWSQRLAVGLWVLALIGVAATFVPGIGIRAGGAHRWIHLPLSQRFEPAELLRVTFPVVMALVLTRESTRFRFLGGPAGAALISLPLWLVLEQPDFGSFAICAIVGLTLVFAHGLKWRFVIAGIASFATAAYFLIIHAPYRLARMKSFVDPWADPAERGFQVIQSMLSFYSGGLSGVGIGHGQGKLFFLPEAHTDFTLAVLGEEAGFIGFALVILIYGYLMFRGFQIAMKANASRERLVAVGLTVAMAFSVFVNAGVVTGMLPTKGLTLPFMSYGGSSLVCTGVAYGLLLSLERHLRVSTLRAGGVKRW